MHDRRWLYNANQEERIFEREEVEKALKEGWKFWPWEIDKSKVENKKERKKKLQEDKSDTKEDDILTNVDIENL